MALYDNRQMNKMRQDAIRRSQEMHRRSMVNTSHYSQGQQKRADLPPEKPVQEEEVRNSGMNSKTQPAFRQSAKKESQLSEMLGRILDGKIDSDKLMIIALMVILAREGADMKLILALGYILI